MVISPQERGYDTFRATHGELVDVLLTEDCWRARGHEYSVLNLGDTYLAGRAID